MSIIPLHIQKRFEQRWAARFVSPVASAAPKGIGLKRLVHSLHDGKSKRKTRWVESAGLGGSSAASALPSRQRVGCCEDNNCGYER